MNNNILKKVKYFFLILALNHVTNLHPVTTDTDLAIIFLISAFYFHFKGLRYDPGILFIIIFFVLINFASALFYGMFQITTLIGMIFRLYSFPEIKVIEGIGN